VRERERKEKREKEKREKKKETKQTKIINDQEGTNNPEATMREEPGIT